MKNLFTLIILVSFFSLTAKAQIQKGAILTGGGISFSNQDIETGRTVNGTFSLGMFEDDFIALSPQIGFFANESLLLGAGIQYEYSYFRSISITNGVTNVFSRQKSNMIFVNPYVQKFHRLTDNLFFIFSLNLLFGFGTSKETLNQDTDNDLTGWRVNLTPGLTYFVSQKWAVSVIFGQFFYNRTKEEVESTPNFTGEPEIINRDYGLDLSFNSFGVNVRYFLRNNPG